MGDHYQTLGVPRDADAAAIKAAYRRLAAVHHPDKGGKVEVFQAIQAAYATLSDPDKRAYYDRTGGDAPRARSEMEEIIPLVVGAFDRAIEAAQGGFSSKGFTRTNITASMERILGDDRKRGAEAIKSLDRSITELEDQRRRLGFTGEEGKNILDSMLSQRIRDAGEMRAKNEATIALVEKTIEHVKLYGWEVDPAPEVRIHFHAGGVLGDEYLKALLADTLRHPGMFSARMPMMASGERIIMRRPPIVSAPRHLKAPNRRRATIAKGIGLYSRPNTCTLDADGKQVPRPRGSWGNFEQRVAAIQGS